MIAAIAREFLLTPLAFVQAAIRRRTGLLPHECAHPYDQADLVRMICGQCGMTKTETRGKRQDDEEPKE
jgi:hypothetical protein